MKIKSYQALVASAAIMCLTPVFADEVAVPCSAPNGMRARCFEVKKVDRDATAVCQITGSNACGLVEATCPDAKNGTVLLPAEFKADLYVVEYFPTDKNDKNFGKPIPKASQDVKDPKYPTVQAVEESKENDIGEMFNTFNLSIDEVPENNRDGIKEYRQKFTTQSQSFLTNAGYPDAANVEPRLTGFEVKAGAVLDKAISGVCVDGKIRKFGKPYAQCMKTELHYIDGAKSKVKSQFGICAAYASCQRVTQNLNGTVSVQSFAKAIVACPALKKGECRDVSDCANDENEFGVAQPAFSSDQINQIETEFGGTLVK